MAKHITKTKNIFKSGTYGIAVDHNGNIYFSKGKEGVYQVNQKDDARTSNVIKGTYDIRGIVWNRENILYLCDWENHRVLSYSLTDGTIVVVSGNGQGHRDGTVGDALFNHPSGITMDNDGILYVTEKHCVRKILLAEGIVQTIAGSQHLGHKDGETDRAMFSGPTGIVVGHDGSIYVADTDNHSIRKIKNGIVSTIVNAEKSLHMLKYPRSLVLEDNGTLMVADSGMGIHVITLEDNAIATPAELQINKNSWALTKDARGNTLLATSSLNAPDNIWMFPAFKFNGQVLLNSKTTWKHIRLFVVGDSGAGKTSVVRWLQGQPFESSHNSTDSVDISLVEASTWKSVTFDIKDYIAEAVKTTKYSQYTSHKMELPSAELKGTLPIAAATAIVMSSPLDALIPSIKIAYSLFQSANTPIDSKLARTFPLPNPKMNLPTALSQDISNRLSSKVQLAFHVWDFAGQEEYYNTHHIFMTESAVYVFVLDISGSIDLTRVKFWLDSIKFYVESATVVFIGTHTDKFPSQDRVDEIMNDLKKELSKYSNISQWLAVSCKNDSPTQTQQALTSVSKQLVLPQCNLSWMLLYEALADQSVHNNNNNSSVISYISLDQATETAANFQIYGKELKEALSFYHTTGFMLYYDEPHLNRFIFTKPQELINVLKSVITALGLADKLEKEELIKLHQEGRVSNDTLKTIWKEYDTELFTLFKELLVKFGLAFLDPVQETEERDLLIPCLVRATDQVLLHRFNSTPICIQCQIETIPPLGFANRLIATIFSATSVGGVAWCRIFEGGCAFSKNSIQFLITTAPGQVIIKALPISQSTVSHIMSPIQMILENIYVTAKAHKPAKISTSSTCFLCQKNQIVSDLQKDNIQLRKFVEGHFICSVCRSQHSPEVIEQIFLFPPISGSDGPPTRVTEVLNTSERWNQLCDILDSSESLWKSFGRHSLINTAQSTLNKYDTISKHDPYFSASEEIIQNWQHTTEATITNFMKILKDINCQTAVNLVESWIDSK